MNCSAATNSLACGKLPSLRAFSRRRCVGSSVFPLRSAMARHNPNIRRAVAHACPLSSQQNPRKQRRDPAQHQQRGQHLRGNASESSCSCGLSRPSSASATSTITSSATTGSARRTPDGKQARSQADQRLRRRRVRRRRRRPECVSRLCANSRSTSRSSPSAKNSMPAISCANTSSTPNRLRCSDRWSTRMRIRPASPAPAPPA